MKKNSNRFNILQLFVLLGFITVLHSYKVSSSENMVNDNWRELGRVKAGHNGDHDRIEIIGPHDSYRRLKFRVENSALNMSKMVVVYEDGAPENIDVKNDIPKGGESRSIDLKGGKRKLKSVEFWFDTKGVLNGKAEVILYGQK
jgi:sorbitol-specific phosphotransferase system component IIA